MGRLYQNTGQERVHPGLPADHSARKEESSKGFKDMVKCVFQKDPWRGRWWVGKNGEGLETRRPVRGPGREKA